MGKIVFSVKGMSCMGCVNTVRRVLMDRDGVATVNVDLPGGSVDVEYDSTRIQPDALRTAIVEAGYEVV
jgi:copper chaperone